MFCKNCGKEIADEALACPNCGAPTQPTQTSTSAAPVRNPQDGRGLSIAALVLGICGVVLFWLPVFNLIVLACAVLGIIFGLKGRKKSIDAYGKASGLATAGLVLGIIGASICGLGVLTCTVCTSCTGCGIMSRL